jgi:DNA-3-methyladenine glycosylase I
MAADPRIVRHRGKIVAAIANARATLALRDRGDSLAALIWQYRPPSGRVPRRLSDLPSSTPQSTSLSADLRQLGFVYVGPTTVYATMQALGVVNDHLQGCHFRQVAEAERSKFIPPIGPDGDR